jgi:hypothetical protein
MFVTPHFPKLNEKSFLDVTNSKAINAPYYNYDYKEFDNLIALRRKKSSIDQILAETKRLYEERKKQILEDSRDIEGYDVVFAWENHLDHIQHLAMMRPQTIKDYYIDVNKYVEELKKIVGNCEFIIVSDHGFDFETADHSLYGFCSSNVELDPQPKKITDFYRLIVKEDEEKERVMEKLKSLGYI